MDKGHIAQLMSNEIKWEKKLVGFKFETSITFFFYKVNRFHYTEMYQTQLVKIAHQPDRCSNYPSAYVRMYVDEWILSGKLLVCHKLSSSELNLAMGESVCALQKAGRRARALAHHKQREHIVCAHSSHNTIGNYFRVFEYIYFFFPVLTNLCELFRLWFEAMACLVVLPLILFTHSPICMKSELIISFIFV